LGDVKAEALAKPLAVTLAEGRADTVDESNYYPVEEAMARRLGDTSPMKRPRHWSIRYLPLYQRRTLRPLAKNWAMRRPGFRSKRWLATYKWWPRY